MTSIFEDWWRNCLLVAAIALVPCVVVWLLVVFSIRRLNAEQAAWERWQAEVAIRLSIEASSRQLRRMGALGNLVANVAHDFNNLLMVVASNMELARRKNFNDVESEVVAVERATSGAESLARRLMSVARKQPLKQELIDPATWLAGIAELVKSSVRANIVVSIELSPELWPVMADPVELELALVNIVVNAQRRDAARRARRDPLPERAREGWRNRTAHWRVRADLDLGQRRRHERRRPPARVRAALHDQGARRGHGPRARAGARRVRAGGRDRAHHERAWARERPCGFICRIIMWRRPWRRKSTCRRAACAAGAGALGRGAPAGARTRVARNVGAAGRGQRGCRGGRRGGAGSVRLHRASRGKRRRRVRIARPGLRLRPRAVRHPDARQA